MLFENDFIEISLEDGVIIMHTKKIGFPIKSFDQVMQEIPRLKINSFPELRKALTMENMRSEIGMLAPKIEIKISSDKMKTDAELFLTDAEMETSIDELPGLVKEALQEKGITSKLSEIDWSAIRAKKPFLVSEGTPAVKGEDARITYIELPERRPVIREDGSANYYEMNFVTPVRKGDWLGEKIPPQEGTPGVDLFGTEFPGKKGLDAALHYDHKSVEEVEEDGKIVLRALHGGVLEIQNGAVGIGQQLIIDGDVGPETGSITFDGTVVISGTVLAGYSVIATGDISVGANEGVTNAKELRSEQADIYIQGGVFGGGSTVIEAKDRIYIKHANDCCLFANTVHVGLYLLGSEVIADYVYVDRNKGKIIGGTTEGTYRIECAVAGNQHERATFLCARGVDKEALHIEVQQMAQKIKNLQKQIIQFESHIDSLEGVKDLLTGAKLEAYHKIIETLESSRNEVYVLDESIQKNLRIMKEAIRPQIEITQEVNAGVTIQVSSKTSIIEASTKGTFEVMDGVLNV